MGLGGVFLQLLCFASDFPNPTQEVILLTRQNGFIPHSGSGRCTASPGVLGTNSLSGVESPTERPRSLVLASRREPGFTFDRHVNHCESSSECSHPFPEVCSLRFTHVLSTSWCSVTFVHFFCVDLQAPSADCVGGGFSHDPTLSWSQQQEEYPKGFENRFF